MTYKNFLRATATNGTAFSILVDPSACVDTSSHRIDMGVGDVVTWRCKFNDGTISRARAQLNTDPERTNMNFETYSAPGTFPFVFPFIFTGEGVVLEVSADGGSNWTAIGNNTDSLLSHSGSDVRFRMTSYDSGVYWKTADDSGYEVPILLRFT